MCNKVWPFRDVVTLYEKTDASATVQWHTCQIAIQFWPRCIDNDAFHKLDQVGVLLVSYDAKVVPFHLDMTPRSHMLHRGEDLHPM